MKKILTLFALLLAAGSTLLAQNPTKLAKPTWDAHFMSKEVTALAQKTSPRTVNLTKLGEETDTLLYPASCKQWFEKNKVQLHGTSFDDGFEMSPMKGMELKTTWISKYKTLETKSKTYYLSHVHEQDHVVILFYGDQPDEFQVINNVSVVVVRDRLTEKVKGSFDFTEYAYNPVYEPKVKMHVYQDVLWAYVANDVLFVSTAHWTYSNTTQEQNGYITAISLKTKKVLWRTAPKVSNSINFVATDDMLITAYGYTREGAKVYAIDQKTGKICGQLEIANAKSGKKHIEYLYLDGKTLHLKAFDNTAFKVSVN